MAFAARVADQLLRSGQFPTLTSGVADEAAREGFVLAQAWDVMSFSKVGASVNAQGETGRLSGSISIGGEDYSIEGDLTPDHHYSVSTASELVGRKRMLVAGRFEFHGNFIRVSPYIIGDLVDRSKGENGDWDFRMSWRNQVRIHPEQIRAFENVTGKSRPSAAEVKAVAAMSEEDVKNAFAAIIGEPFIPKDWGGEKSDLQTNHLVVRGEPQSAAFIFKGPGMPGELHPSRMGRRGDQLVRAFEEPVEIVVIQHHSKIANSVVRMAEALASDAARPRRYCVLDGADTARILKAYGRLPPH
jgi:hypothetical protein